jgi:hypothetical protein
MKTVIIASTLLALVLAACGSSKEANNGNFEKALNAHLASNCITVQPFVMKAERQRYPMTVELQPENAFIPQAQIDENNANLTRPVDVLVKVGLLSVSAGSKKEKTLYGESVTVPTRIYALTDLGKKTILSSDSTAMCAGHLKVDKVVQFTSPNSALGQTISEVLFTSSPVDVPDWAKSADVQNVYGLANQLAEHRRATRRLVLTSDGWIDASDVSK